MEELLAGAPVSARPLVKIGMLSAAHKAWRVGKVPYRSVSSSSSGKTNRVVCILFTHMTELHCSTSRRGSITHKGGFCASQDGRAAC
jgi:hypothetical protein